MTVALVTGAARGIGAATARRLAADGWQVVLVDACADDPALGYALATKADLDAAVAAAGPGAVGVVADVRDQTALDEAVALAEERFGGLDAVIAGAGAIAGGTPSWEAPEELWASMLGINLEGVWRTIRAAVPALLRRPAPRRGRVVAIASAGGVVGLPLLGPYCAAKAGVIGLVRAVAAELGPMGVTANAVAPGSTETAMLDASAAVYGLGGTAEFATHHMIPRLLRPDEPAALIAWLCSEQAGGITGATIPVDAGMAAK